MNNKELFWRLYKAKSEEDVDNILAGISSHSAISWVPYGGNQSNFGIVEAQQASAIPALVEKVTNSIDAILMKKCLENGVDPKSSAAPQSVAEAVAEYFPKSESWDLPKIRQTQSENIQILAHGPKLQTSLVIYDNGEGQHPENFESTFLSLLRGNKTEIKFVQGKYNMGGAGAVAFCGRKRFQLVASKRFDGKGDFGFTLVRKHPLTDDEKQNTKATWYEYFLIDEKIGHFPIQTLDLGLRGREFSTGTVLKLYSYDLPSGTRSVISRDLNLSLNEYLFEPALPLFTIDNNERYPDDNNPERDLYGLKRRLESEAERYIEDMFTEEYEDAEIGRMTITVYVFRPRVDERGAKESKDTIRREFFKNQMPITLSLNGQVHGHFDYGFITRTLKFPILKDYLLIHVDCTELEMDFRNELFMASRDRVKDGSETQKLRKTLGDMLRKGSLAELYKRRKLAISSHNEDSSKLLQDLSKNLPMQPELIKLLNQTLQIENQQSGKNTKAPPAAKKKAKRTEAPFNPQRFPSSFKINARTDGEIPVVQIPKGQDRTIRFSTDVEDRFFDRSDEPGELKLTLLEESSNESDGGTAPGTPSKAGEQFNVIVSSPKDGQIRVNMAPNRDLGVGQSIRLKACLSSKVDDLEQIFLVRITDVEKARKREKNLDVEPPVGLPKLERVFKNPKDEGALSWEKLENNGIEMSHKNVVSLNIEEDQLQAIYINMDSKVILSNLQKNRNEEQIQIGTNRYLSTVYFHTLFLYMILKNRKFEFKQSLSGETTEPELADFIKDLLDNHYSEFLMNFEMEGLIESLAD